MTVTLTAQYRTPGVFLLFMSAKLTHRKYAFKTLLSENCFRHLTSQMSEGRYWFGYTLNSQFGLVMVGGIGNSDTFPSESTTDGINIDSSSVAEFGEQVSGNCLVNVNDTTLISFGGYDGRIAVHTIGNSEWEVRNSRA